MGRRSRHTAKTGDKSIYKSRSTSTNDAESNDNDSDDNDPMYNEVERYHNRKEEENFMKLDGGDSEDDENIEDAYLEEEAGREVEKARLEEMDDADFMLDGVGGDNEDADVDQEDENKSSQTKSKSNVETIQSIRSSRQNLSKLSKSEKIKFLKANHPELLPLVQHFTQPIQDLNETTMAAAGALLKRGVVNGAKEAKAVGATTAGLQYLITKSMLQASNALNLSLYLLLKADLASKKTADADMDLVEEDDGDDIRTHPVMDRLDQLSRLTDKLKEGVEDKIPRLQDQMNNLVKAAALMEGGELSSSEGSDSSDEEETPSSEPREDDESVDSSAEQQSRDSRIDEDDDENSSDSDEERETQEAIQRRIMTEAKFALRHQDIDHDVKKSAKRKRRIAHTSSDYGDETEELDGRTLAASLEKKQMYTVAPKYPRLEGEIDGERAIGKTILKNRGLVAHKPKINRNPRVKKREQYRKALIRRKGAVREVRTDEGHVYGGEATGIKSGISRSRKLAR
ncbi:hypothetical protein ACHAXH_008103 [Discostella pseudostelligera]